MSSRITFSGTTNGSGSPGFCEWDARIAAIKFGRSLVIRFENTALGKLSRLVGRPIALGRLDHIFTPLVTAHFRSASDDR